MAAPSLVQRVHDVLKQGVFNAPTDLVDVSTDDHGDIHVVVVSRKFDGRRLREKQDLIWNELQSKLKPKEWGKVTLSVGVSPEEIKST